MTTDQLQVWLWIAWGSRSLQSTLITLVECESALSQAATSEANKITQSAKKCSSSDSHLRLNPKIDFYVKNTTALKSWFTAQNEKNGFVMILNKSIEGYLFCNSPIWAQELGKI